MQDEPRCPTKWEHLVAEGYRIVIKNSAYIDQGIVIQKFMGNENNEIGFRLTAKKALALSEWLIKYAKYVEQIPSRGGR